jgi:hypothetical protein
MGLINKILGLLVAVWASMIALTVGCVAQYPFGVSVRTSALIGVGILALIFALLVATGRFEKLQKSK